MPSPTGLTHAVMQTLSHGDHLLQLVSGDQADDNRFIQQFSRNTDTNQLAQCVRERATRQGEIADVIHSYGQTAAGIRLEFNTLTAMERVVVADLPQGEGMQAGEKNNQTVVPQGRQVLDEIQRFHKNAEVEAETQLAAQYSPVKHQILLRLAVFIGFLAFILECGRRLKTMMIECDNATDRFAV